MARKSRRQTQQPQEVVSPIAETYKAIPRIKTAAYARLSVEKETDESIETQITMLYQYIADHDEFDLIDTYADNGYTGTNFDRPDFNRMMEDVRTGRIQCIIVKDLSRFGRDLVETGYYIETLLPRLNVRLIAINDNFDSSREEDRNSIAVPIKNLVNEMYAKDFSRKATSYYELHSQLGDAKILRSTYGYRLDRENNILIPNPDTAPIVQMIFRWFLSGHPISEIVKRLKVLGVLTPEAYKRTYEENKPVPETDRWRLDRVKCILTNQTYMGDTVHGKRRKTLYRNIDMYHTPKEEWIIHRHTHPALVSEEDFNRVQEMFEQVSRKYSADRTNAKKNRELSIDYFPQKMVCMDCGSSMSLDRYSHGKYNQSVDGAYYTCKGNDLVKGCGKRIHEEYLRLMVIDQIRLLVANLSEQKNLIVNMQTGRADNSAKRSIDAKINHAYFKIAELDEMLGTLYENYAEGLVEAEDYQMMKERYQGEKQSMQDRVASLEEDRRRMDKDIAMFIEMEKDLDRFLKTHSNHAELIDKFVERVYVSGTERMEIRFKCDDIFKRVCAAMERSEDT